MHAKETVGRPTPTDRQPVVWFAAWEDGREVWEFDVDGNETVFSREAVPKEGLAELGFLVKGVVYLFDMRDGSLWLGSRYLGLGLAQKRGWLDLCGPGERDPIQFKSAHADFRLTGAVQGKVGTLHSYNIGWKGKLDRGGRIWQAKVILRLDAVSFRPTVSLNAHPLE